MPQSQNRSLPRLALLGAGILILAIGALALRQPGAAKSGPTFEVTFDAALSDQPLDGRLVLVLARDSTREPRFQYTSSPSGQPGFGIQVENWEPSTVALVDNSATGFPVQSMDQLPEGEYWVQALINRYETFNLATGHTVQLPPDRGEGQVWNRKPGNFYSTPIKINIDPNRSEKFKIVLDQEIPPIEPPEDTEYVKHIRIQSDLLTEFYGTPMYLGAHVLLPAGFDENPDARYPLAIFHGHFPADINNWRETPPDPDEPCVYAARFSMDCYNRIVAQEAYDFYQKWTGPDYPLRMLIVEIQHPTPYYDDSYAVNSASQGPWGDAITYELIPEIERRFRGIGEGWTRFLYGGSTGGWEAMAAQIFYPDEYNGAFIACPDPIDFRQFTVVNLYEDENAYFQDNDPYFPTPRPARRNYLGHVSATIEEDAKFETVLGSRVRSGQQWDIWEATYSPQASDGYPMRIWDRETGEIDKEVAEYWKENYDLSYILRRDWDKGLGEKLEGKLHIYTGDMDNYYLNNAVYLVEEFLESTTDPYYAGEVAYGDRDEHCWNGDPDQPNAISRLRYHEMYASKILNRLLSTAPAGADTRSWRY